MYRYYITGYAIPVDIIHRDKDLENWKWKSYDIEDHDNFTFLILKSWE